MVCKPCAVASWIVLFAALLAIFVCFSMAFLATDEYKSVWYAGLVVSLFVGYLAGKTAECYEKPEE